MRVPSPARIALLVMMLVVLGVVLGGLLTAARPPASTRTMVSIGGPFRLTSHKGETLSDADLKGKPFAIFFGFTHCPEVCPTTLYDLVDMIQELGPAGNKLAVLFVTVDPDRDTVELLSTYASSIDTRLIGLTGTPAEIEAIAKTYTASFRKVPTASGEYTMDHTALVFLMDDAGKFFSTLDYHESRAAKLAKLRRLLAR